MAKNRFYSLRQMPVLQEVEFHEIANIFPNMEDEEYRALVEDIKKHGLREPIWTYQGKIIDGRHRYRACLELGVEPKFREWDGNGSLVAFVISLNLHRRHLTSSQKAAIAVEILPWLEKEAAERKRKLGSIAATNQHYGKNFRWVPQIFADPTGNNWEPVSQKIAKDKDEIFEQTNHNQESKQENNQSNKNEQPACSVLQPEQSAVEKTLELPKREAREQAAKFMGTNRLYVSTAKKIKEKDPEVLKKVKEGRLTLPEAEKIISLSQETRKQVIEKIENGEAKNVKDAIKKIEQQAKQKTVAQLIVSSNSNEWYTPPEYIEAARRVLGRIDLDPASCEEANKVVQASRYYTAQDDGLKYDWPGRVWLNPPYGGLTAKFVNKLVEQYKLGITTEAILLVNAHATDTDWFQPLWDYVLCFTDHRIDFYRPGGQSGKGSTHGSVFVYLGERQKVFAREFARFGAIVRRWVPDDKTA